MRRIRHHRDLGAGLSLATVPGSWGQRRCPERFDSADLWTRPKRMGNGVAHRQLTMCEGRPEVPLTQGGTPGSGQRTAPGKRGCLARMMDPWAPLRRFPGSCHATSRSEPESSIPSPSRSLASRPSDCQLYGFDLIPIQMNSFHAQDRGIAFTSNCRSLTSKSTTSASASTIQAACAVDAGSV